MIWEWPSSDTEGNANCSSPSIVVLLCRFSFCSLVLWKYLRVFREVWMCRDRWLFRGILKSLILPLGVMISRALFSLCSCQYFWFCTFWNDLRKLSNWSTDVSKQKLDPSNGAILTFLYIFESMASLKAIAGFSYFLWLRISASGLTE